ncbi:MAG TPA: TAXI family TRAP transporter solute-binding subunit [Candidatus Methylomirabilis sp.]|nr:TAXI family TRAP transporter solute-binding subunit [Candidatus Methylomirabilis sp.]
MGITGSKARWSCLTLATAILALFFGETDMLTGSAADRMKVSLGTATPGGGFPVYGQAVAETINQTDPSLSVEPRNTRGSAENVPLLEAGQLDLALVQGESAYEALNGIGRPRADLWILAAMYASPGMFIVRADSPYRSIDDLKGKPVVFGAAGSGLGILARYVLDGLGLDRDRDFQPIFLEHAGDGPPLVLEGRAAALWGGSVGWPPFLAVAQGPAGGRFIIPDAAGVQRILSTHPFLKPITVQAGSFPGQVVPLHTVGSWSFILTRRTLPDNLAYRLAKALHQAQEVLSRRLPQARETAAANTIGAAPRLDLIHPGVQRYLRELGMLR